MANILAIVGRPNVGKSTLFNRLVESRQAIMDNMPGVTRDRHYGVGEWNGKKFTVIDTGGYVEGSDDVFEGAIRKQVKEALVEASVILFLVDVNEGLHPLDEEFARLLRTLKKPLFLAANKSDNPQKAMGSVEFFQLNLTDKIHEISSANGSGTGDLLDEICAHFSNDEPESQDSLPKIAIVGRPNAGKSSYLNVLLGTERTIVTDIAGTTRDAIHTRYNLYGKDFILIDTAGIRKKSKVHEDIEFYSVLRAIKAIEESDVCIVMIDATRGFEAQDMNIVNLAHRYKKGMVIMYNKWDLVEKSTNTSIEIQRYIKERLGPVGYMPVIFTSVLTKQRVFQSIELALKAFENKTKKVPTSQLNERLLKEIENYPPPAIRGKYIKIKYITQLPTPSPTFAFFCNHPKDIKEAYQRFLVNKIREHFDFDGVSVQVVFRQK